MSAKRFLPFLAMIAVIVGVLYLFNQHPEWTEDEEERKTREFYTELIEATDKQITTFSKGDTTNWVALQDLTKTTLANAELMKRHPTVSADLAKASYKTFKSYYDSWRLSDKLDTPPHVRLNELQAILGTCNAISEYKASMTKYRNPFADAVALFSPGRRHLEHRLNECKAYKFDANRYQTLADELAECESQLGLSPQHKRWVAKVQNHKECHSKFHNQYSRLKTSAMISNVDPNKIVLPTSTAVNTQFVCGGRRFEIGQFQHYLDLGRGDEWLKPLY